MSLDFANQRTLFYFLQMMTTLALYVLMQKIAMFHYYLNLTSWSLTQMILKMVIEYRATDSKTLLKFVVVGDPYLCTPQKEE